MLRHRSIVLFFDNEIDWVIQGRARPAVEADLLVCSGGRKVFNVIRVSLRRRVVAMRIAAIDLKANNQG